MWRRKSSLEEKMDVSTHDHYVYLEGFYAGKRAGTAWMDWLWRGKGEAPSTEPDSPYRRLEKHYEKRWKRGER